MMKKFLRISITIFTLMCICVSTLTFANAQDWTTNNYTKDIKISGKECSIQRAPGDYGTYYKTVYDQREGRINHQFICYNPSTNDWTYASSYDSSYSIEGTVSGTISYNGFEIAVEITTGCEVTATIPADPSRQSKLALYSDFYIDRYKVYFVQNGVEKFVKYDYKLVDIDGTSSMEVVYR